MTGPECGDPLLVGRRVRVDIGPCRRQAGLCGPGHHLLVVRTGCLHCHALTANDATRCVHCGHEPRTIDARCNCRAHVAERGGRWQPKQRQAMPQIQPPGGERA